MSLQSYAPCNLCGSLMMPGNQIEGLPILVHEICDWPWRARTDRAIQASRERNEAWSGKLRDCPRCSHRFKSVQDLGVCPSCMHRFLASQPEANPSATNLNTSEPLPRESEVVAHLEGLKTQLIELLRGESGAQDSNGMFRLPPDKQEPFRELLAAIRDAMTNWDEFANSLESD